MYTTKLSFIHLSPILFHNLLLTICIAEKTLSTVAVATGRSNDNLISIYTNRNIKFFFVFTIFSARLAIPSISENNLNYTFNINSSKSKPISIHIYMHIISILIKLYLIISRYLIEEQCLVYVQEEQFLKTCFLLDILLTNKSCENIKFQ